jgi:hypothetical protein
MTNHLLLLGAGYSHNWGGWLANRFFDILMSEPAVQGDAGLRDLLWKHRNAGGFEAALEELQLGVLDQTDLQPRLDGLETALRAVFARMNGAFFRREGGYEFNNATGWFIREMLVSFDAIFSLNQDLLLERAYINDGNIGLTGARRWDGAVLPGVRWPHPRPADYLPTEWDAARWIVDGPVETPKRMQPVYKLHGSSSWFRPDGSNLLVLGGAKADRIAEAQILAEYFTEFEHRLALAETRIMIIGYGFNDAHINAALVAAADTGLKMFIVDPRGANAFDHVDDPAPFRSMFIGASTPALSVTFAGDVAERDNIMRFFTA